MKHTFVFPPPPPPGHELDMSVSVFVWVCGPPSQRDYIIGLFDINQWYHAQMPNAVRWRRSGEHTGCVFACECV